MKNQKPEENKQTPPEPKVIKKRKR